MENRIIKVDIICPKCSEKALFHSVLVGSYKLYPDRNGKATCTNCGFSGLHVFNNTDYYYQIDIGNRKLFAQTFDHLLFLRNYFFHHKNEAKFKSPELDFPRLFYLKRKEIVFKIDKIKIKHNESK